jgi:hypothetical protein
MYKTKLHENTTNRETGVRERRVHQLNEEKEKILNIHLAEWREFERKKAEKHKCEIECQSPNKSYKRNSNKKNPLKGITEKFNKLEIRTDSNKNLQPVRLQPNIANVKSQKLITE